MTTDRELKKVKSPFVRPNPHRKEGSNAEDICRQDKTKTKRLGDRVAVQHFDPGDKEKERTSERHCTEAILRG